MMSKENTTVLSHPDCLTSIITCIFFHMKKKVIFSFTTKEARQKNNQAAGERLIISGEKIKLYCLIIFQFKTRSIHPCLSVNPVDKMPQRYYLRNVWQMQDCGRRENVLAVLWARSLESVQGRVDEVLGQTSVLLIRWKCWANTQKIIIMLTTHKTPPTPSTQK